MQFCFDNCGSFENYAFDELLDNGSARSLSLVCSFYIITVAYKKRIQSQILSNCEIMMKRFQDTVGSQREINRIGLIVMKWFFLSSNSCFVAYYNVAMPMRDLCQLFIFIRQWDQKCNDKIFWSEREKTSKLGMERKEKRSIVLE